MLSFLVFSTEKENGSLNKPLFLLTKILSLFPSSMSAIFMRSFTAANYRIGEVAKHWDPSREWDNTAPLNQFCVPFIFYRAKIIVCSIRKIHWH